jgi:membrane protein insertase Oxa1/YidC/SpoIIIJ
VPLIDLLDNTLIRSLMDIYAFLFDGLSEAVGGRGWALILFSLALNVVLLPIYYQMERAGRLGLESREAMRSEIDRIKANYAGRERYYYIQTIHRQFKHRPISVVLSSSDLYLQVLVFATVYRYLAAHPDLAGTAFLVIDDLSRPDGLLWGVHLLPLVMTLLNLASAVHYRHDKGKRRAAFLIAALFLVLLYASPSGLVLYWTVNNAVSLARNYVQRKIAPRVPAGIARGLARLASQE